MSSDVAIFLDLDNVVIGAQEANLNFDIDTIVDHVRELTQGRIVLRRAYGDWRRNRRVPEALTVAGFELQASVRLGTMSKNLADMQMVVDAMETLIYGHNFGTYVLVTGDRDFMPLVQALRKRGKQVIGMGLRHTSSRSLVGLCDRYIFYEDLVEAMPHNDEQHLGELIQEAFDALVLEDSDRVPASLLKQKMHDLSRGAFAQSRGGRKSFRQLLERYPERVRLVQDGTTLYVAAAQAPNAATAVVPAVAKLDEAQCAALLSRALEEIDTTQRVAASVLKQRLDELSNGAFSVSRPEGESFAQFLAAHPELATVEKENSTLYVRPAQAMATNALPARYRTYLKKAGLRVVPAATRLQLLKAVLNLLQSEEGLRWRAIVDHLAEQFAAETEPAISKNVIGDVLRVARRAGVIDVDGGGGSLAAAEVALALNGARPFQDAVMRCDAAYLTQLAAGDDPFDLEAAAIALYDSPSHARYLKVIQNRLADNGRV